jgi:hypothetical protein
VNWAERNFLQVEESKLLPGYDYGFWKNYGQNSAQGSGFSAKSYSEQQLTANEIVPAPVTTGRPGHFDW